MEFCKLSLCLSCHQVFESSGKSCRSCGLVLFVGWEQYRRVAAGAVKRHGSDAEYPSGCPPGQLAGCVVGTALLHQHIPLVSWQWCSLGSPGIPSLWFLRSLGNLRKLKLLGRTGASVTLFVRCSHASPSRRARTPSRGAFYSFCQHHPEADKSYLEK